MKLAEVTPHSDLATTRCDPAAQIGATSTTGGYLTDASALPLRIGERGRSLTQVGKAIDHKDTPNSTSERLKCRRQQLVENVCVHYLFCC